MTRTLAAIALCVLSFAPASPQAAAMGRTLLTVLDAAQPETLVPVIVRLRDPASASIDMQAFRQDDRSARRRALVQALRSRAVRSQPSMAATLLRQGGRQLRALWLINGLAAQLPAAAIRTLSTHPQVESIGLDEAIPLWNEIVPGAAPAHWNLEYIRAPDVWNLGHQGHGVVIATLDTGVDPSHPDIGPRWRGGANSWFDPNGEHPTPADSDGHGTWTMGVLVGGDAGGSVIGVAPGAQWVAVKIFDDAGVASLSAIHLGFQWLLDPDGDPATDDAPDIVNNSWGFEEAPNVCIGEFETDIQVLRAAGIAVVFAAGNTGPAEASSISPANNTGPVAVGAVDNAQSLANFSARGPSACGSGQFPLLSAPGVGIRTSDRCFGPICDYTTVSGTSFAAPHVAGAMALLLSAVPDASIEAVEAALAQTAVDLGVVGPDSGYGQGFIDVMAALQALRCPADGVDTDGDGVTDACDNCVLIANAGQRDSDADGYGNRCDTDLNNDGITNSLDTALLRTAYLSGDADADFNGDGIVNGLDIGVLRSFYLQPPGPSRAVP
ncbi:MAG: S8 family serine peptidase [Pseudomonadota bacterium]